MQRLRRCVVLAITCAAVASGVVIAQLSPHVAGAALLPSHVVPLVPARLLDTRDGVENVTVDNMAQGGGAVAADSHRVLDVTGRGGVPSDASAVFLNVTAVTPAAPGFITVYPCNVARPTASNLNYTAGDFVPNMVLAQLDGDGNVCVYTLAASHIVIDVNGYVPDGGGVITVEPARLMETRSGPGETTVDGLFQGMGRLAAGSETELRLPNRANLANQARSVFLNVAVINPSGPGFVTMYPCGTERPTASQLNYGPGDVVANAVFARGDPSNGLVCIYTLAETDLIVDVTGYVEPMAEDGVRTVSPRRLLETRMGEIFVTTDGLFEGDGIVPAGVEVPLRVAGRGGVPNNAPAAFLNITVVEPAEAGFLTAYPCGTARPVASNLNYQSGDVVPNAVLSGIGMDGSVCLYSLATTHIVVDVNGFVGAPPTPPPATTTCVVGTATVDTSIPQSQCDTLVAFYNATAGPSWNVRTGWLSSTDPCTWYGVTCEGGAVTRLDYYSNNMNGPLPPEIGDLVGLVELDLWVNGITSLPPEIGNLTLLTSLTVGSNELAGVPAELWTLTGLERLDVSYSGITALPPEIGGMTNLRSLEVNGNEIGVLPPELVTLTGLTTLDVGYTGITALPAGFEALTALERLRLNATPIGFPAVITSLTSLVSLEMHGTGMTSIPANIGELVNLESASFSAGDLTSLPDGLWTLSKLEYLGIGLNELTSLPVEVGDLPALNYLNARDNPWASDLTPAMTALKNRDLMQYMYIGGTSCALINGAELIAWVEALDPNWDANCP